MTRCSDPLKFEAVSDDSHLAEEVLTQLVDAEVPASEVSRVAGLLGAWKTENERRFVGASKQRVRLFVRDVLPKRQKKIWAAEFYESSGLTNQKFVQKNFKSSLSEQPHALEDPATSKALETAEKAKHVSMFAAWMQEAGPPNLRLRSRSRRG